MTAAVRRRCLVIAGMYPPAGGPGALRMVRLAAHLAQSGWGIDIVAPAGRRGFCIDSSLVATSPGVHVERVGLPFSLGTALRSVARPARDAAAGGLRRQLAGRLLDGAKRLRETVAVPDEMVLWAGQAYASALRRSRRVHYDVLLTSSFPFSSHLAGYALARRTGLPWVAELRDPWAGHAFRRHHGRLRRRIDFLLEDRVLRRATAVVVISPTMRTSLLARYGAARANEIAVVPNAYEPGDFAVQLPAVEVPAKHRPPVREILYVGSFNADIDPPDPLLDAVGEVLRRRPEQNQRLRLIVLGGADLACSRRIRRWSHEQGHGGVIQFAGYVPHAEAVRRMQAADALALTLADGMPVYTSKVLEYLASGQPILAAVGRSDCRDLLQKAGGAVVADPADPGPIVDAICRLLDSKPLQLLPRAPEVLRAFTMEAAAAGLSAVLERAARQES